MADLSSTPGSLADLLNSVGISSLASLSPEQQQMVVSMTPDQIQGALQNPAQLKSLSDALKTPTSSPSSPSVSPTSPQQQSKKLSDLVSNAASPENATPEYNGPIAPTSMTAPERPLEAFAAPTAAEALKAPTEAPAQKAHSPLAGALGAGFASLSSSSPQSGVPSPENVREKVHVSNAIKDVMAQLPKMDPKALLKQFDEFDKVTAKDIAAYSNQIDPMTGKSINQFLTETRAKIADIAEQRKDIIPSQAWGQLLESVGHSIVSLMAGAYGMKHGVNLAGLKFDKTNWEERIRTRLQAANDQINDLRGSERDISSEKKDVISQIVKRGEDQKQAAKEIYSQDIRDKRQLFSLGMAEAMQNAREGGKVEKANAQFQFIEDQTNKKFEQQKTLLQRKIDGTADLNAKKILQKQMDTLNKAQVASVTQDDNNINRTIQALQIGANGGSSSTVLKMLIKQIDDGKFPPQLEPIAQAIKSGKSFMSTDYTVALDLAHQVQEVRAASKPVLQTQTSQTEQKVWSGYTDSTGKNKVMLPAGQSLTAEQIKQNGFIKAK